MIVSLGINTKNKKEFLEKINTARTFLKKGSWVHMDWGVRPFASITSYCDPEGARLLKGMQVEMHFMGDRSAIREIPWETYGVKRIFFPLRELKDKARVYARAQKVGIEVGVAYDITDERIVVPEGVRSVLVLAGIPGKSSQKFSPRALEMIGFLKKKYPDVTITADAGINESTALLVKRAGAKRIVSTSFVWKSADPAAAYEQLKKI